MKKRIVTIALVIALLAMCFAGTYAYLSDTDYAVNTMTYGNVTIEQYEYERKPGVVYNATLGADGLQAFTQNQKIYPSVLKVEDGYTLPNDKNEGIKWGDYTYTGTSWDTIFNPARVANAMDKFVFVKNTGSEDLYFRTIVAVECPEGWECGDCGMGDEVGVILGGQYKDNTLGYAYIDGVRYQFFEFTYKDGRILASGAQAHPSLLQVLLHHKLGNEDLKKLGDTLDVLVMTQAVQAKGFDNMDQALTLAFGKLTAEAAAELFD